MKFIVSIKSNESAKSIKPALSAIPYLPPTHLSSARETTLPFQGGYGEFFKNI